MSLAIMGKEFVTAKELITTIVNPLFSLFSFTFCYALFSCIFFSKWVIYYYIICIELKRVLNQSKSLLDKF